VAFTQSPALIEAPPNQIERQHPQTTAVIPAKAGIHFDGLEGRLMVLVLLSTRDRLAPRLAAISPFIHAMIQRCQPGGARHGLSAGKAPLETMCVASGIQRVITFVLGAWLGNAD
jgi:hypothetical protein